MSLFCSNSPISFLKIIRISSFSKILILMNVNSCKFVSGFNAKSVSAIPSFLTPSLIHQRLHCCTSSSSTDVEDESDSKIVFVKGLPLATSEGLLKKAFSEFGEVDRVKIITDKINKQPLGFAYIWFMEQESAQKAVKEMNGEGSPRKCVCEISNKQPLGFAYIWFMEQESAQKAVKEMNGEFFEGRFIMVTIARPGSCKTHVKTTPYKF